MVSWKDKISDPQATTSFLFGGATVNSILDYFSAVDLTSGGTLTTEVGDIATPTIYANNTLQLWDSNKSHKVTFQTPDYNVNHILTFPSEAALGTSDEVVTAAAVQVITGKTIDFTTDNTAQNIPKAALPSSAFFNDQDNSVGAHYMDFTQVGATPGSPASLTRRMFVDTTGKLSLKTSAGAIIDLEESVIADAGGIAAGGTATFSPNGSTKIFNIAHGLSPIPEHVTVTPASVKATSSYVVSIDTTNIILTFSVAPPTGTSDLVFFWAAGYFQQAEPGFTPSSTTTLTNKTMGDALSFVKIAAPADPTLEQGKLYLKQIDSNNNGVFYKIKKAGAIVEVQLG